MYAPTMYAQQTFFCGIGAGPALRPNLTFTDLSAKTHPYVLTSGNGVLVAKLACPVSRHALRKRCHCQTPCLQGPAFCHVKAMPVNCVCKVFWGGTGALVI